MAPEAINLEVVTPERRVVQESAAEVQVPGAAGYLGILPGHTPLLSELGTGVLRYRQGANVHRVVVSGGFVEVRGDRVIVLADFAERAEEIDPAAARADLAAAESRLAAVAASGEWEAAQRDVARARTRVELAGSSSGATQAAGNAH